MEFLKASRRKSLLSEVLHATLNAALAVVLFALVSTGSTFLAFALVLVSKWRILAVRPRYWRANILANIVDLTVSIGTVVLLYLAGTGGEYAVWTQVAVAILYATWLIIIKPRSGKNWIIAQAGIGLFIGTWAILAVAHILPHVATVALMYVTGYGAARHILISREEDQPSLLAMVFGLIAAEIAWVTYHWTVAYSIDGMGDLRLPQAAIIVFMAGFLATRLYMLYAAGKTFRSVDAIVPTIFVIVAVFVLTFLFSSGAGII